MWTHFPTPSPAGREILWRRPADNGELLSSCRGSILTLNLNSHRLKISRSITTDGEEPSKVTGQALSDLTSPSHRHQNEKAQVTNTSSGGRTDSKS